MVNFKKLTDRAKGVVDKRGGSDSLKEDFGELKNIAKGEGTLKEKAKRAKDAVKDPGTKGPDPTAADGQHDSDAARAAGVQRPQPTTDVHENTPESDPPHRSK
jgi:hypothetical protein